MPPSLRQEVSSRLHQHRQRKARTADEQPVLPIAGLQPAARRRVADSVAARFATSTTYRDFLEAEAAMAVQRAEAAADVARRTAEAVAAVQTELLSELDRWTAAPGTTASDAVAVVPQPMPGFKSMADNAVVSIASQTQESATADFWEPRVAEPAEPAVPLPANLLEFPRQLVATRKARPRLAEGPLREDADAAPERAQLRIFEVEAAALSPEPAVESAMPEWHTIRLDSDTEVRTAAEAAPALPVYTAPVGLRVMAFTVDACCIVSALLLSALAASYASPELPGGMAAAVALTGALVAFALLYYMLFFTLNEATPGMRYARIGLCTFSDENPSRSSMRRRMLAILLATLPLGMGLLWACLDEDGLGWHDRMSRMYPREY